MGWLSFASPCCNEASLLFLTQMYSPQMLLSGKAAVMVQRIVTAGLLAHMQVQPKLQMLRDDSNECLSQSDVLEPLALAVSGDLRAILSPQIHLLPQFPCNSVWSQSLGGSTAEVTHFLSFTQGQQCVLINSDTTLRNLTPSAECFYIVSGIFTWFSQAFTNNMNSNENFSSYASTYDSHVTLLACITVILEDSRFVRATMLPVLFLDQWLFLLK